MKRAIGCVFLLVGAAALSLGACQQSGSTQSRREVRVDVTDKGFEPAEVKVPVNRTVTLVMTRKTDQTCAKEVVFASLNQRYALPLNQPARITLPARAEH